MTPRWSELNADPGMVAALDHADGETPRHLIEAEAARIAALGLTKEERKRQREPLRDMRKRWSELLATTSRSSIRLSIKRSSKARCRSSSVGC